MRIVNNNVSYEYLSIALSNKKIWKQAKLFINAGQAKVAPPISSILGQFGVNLIEFCEKFNLTTRKWPTDLIISVDIKVFQNKSFFFKSKPFFYKDVIEWLNLIECFYKTRLSIKKKNEISLMLALYKLYLIEKMLLNEDCIFFNTSDFIVKFLKKTFGYLKSYTFNYEK